MGNKTKWVCSKISASINALHYKHKCIFCCYMVFFLFLLLFMWRAMWAEPGDMVLRICALLWTKLCFPVWPLVGRTEKVIQGQKRRKRLGQAGWQVGWHSGHSSSNPSSEGRNWDGVWMQEDALSPPGLTGKDEASRFNPLIFFQEALFLIKPKLLKT